MGRPLARANIEIFFSDERAEFINCDERADFGLWWVCWEWLGSLDQTARDRLVMNPENAADRLQAPSLRDRADRPVA